MHVVKELCCVKADECSETHRVGLMFNAIEKLLKDSLIKADQLAVDTLKLLKSDILLAAKAIKQDEPSDDVCKGVIARHIKTRQDVIAIYEKTGMDCSTIKEPAEISLLTQFLPAQLSHVELLKVVNQELEGSKIELDKRNMAALIDLILDRTKESAVRADIAKILLEKINVR